MSLYVPQGLETKPHAAVSTFPGRRQQIDLPDRQMFFHKQYRIQFYNDSKLLTGVAAISFNNRLAAYMGGIWLKHAVLLYHNL